MRTTDEDTVFGRYFIEYATNSILGQKLTWSAINHLLLRIPGDPWTRSGAGPRPARVFSARDVVVFLLSYELSVLIPSVYHRQAMVKLVSDSWDIMATPVCFVGSISGGEFAVRVVPNEKISTDVLADGALPFFTVTSRHVLYLLDKVWACAQTYEDTYRLHGLRWNQLKGTVTEKEAP